MIVKNEEANLAACLASVADLVDEIVIVDTGSTDRTKEIALSFGAKVHDFPWIDDFAAARNESLKYATRDWIFWMDADDRVDETNRAKLQVLFEGLQDVNAGYVMKCLCLPGPQAKSATEVDHLRLFRNRGDIRWKYRVHEQILTAVRRTGGEIRWSGIVVHHVGYQDPALRQRKLERDLRILLLDQADHPDDAFILFNLAAIYQEQERPRDALPLLRRSLELSEESDSIVRKLYAMIAQCYNRLEERDHALIAIRQGRSVYPEDIELLFQEGMIFRAFGDSYSAIRAWEHILRIPPGDHFGSIDPGIRNFLTRHNLAMAYQDIGRLKAAEEQWRILIEEHPEYEPGWSGLAELLLRVQDWQSVDPLATQLESRPETSLVGSLLRGRALLARREFDGARDCFLALCEKYPQAMDPRVYLSHVYLHEGTDWAGAERALLDILALDPNNAEASHNLRTLRSDRANWGSQPPM